MFSPIPDDTNFLLKIKMGLVPGFSIVHKFGFNPDIDVAGVYETVWSKGGQYSFRETPTNFYLSSSDASDVGQQFEVILLDVNYNESTHIIQLNGQTGVLIPDGQYLRCNSLMNVSQPSKVTIGDVSIGTETSPVGGVPTLINTVAFAASQNQISNQAVYTVPADHTAFIANLSASVGKNKDATVLGSFREFNGTFKNTEQLGLYQNTVQRTIPFSVMPEKSDLQMIGTAETNNQDIAAGFDFILVDNAYLG